MFKISNNLLPAVISEMFSKNADVHHYNTRQRENLHVPLCKSQAMSRTIKYQGVVLWNLFKSKLKCNNCKLSVFKGSLKLFLLS